MAIINALKASRLFGGLSPQELAKVSGISRAKSYSGGTLIFSQGNEARGFFLIAKGAVKIFQLSPDGKEHLLHTSHEGESFGEAAAFGLGIFPANAETIGEQIASFTLKDATGVLASRLNITQETLSRSLQKLRAQKLLKVEGKRITIEDIASLRAIVENPVF